MLTDKNRHVNVIEIIQYIRLFTKIFIHAHRFLYNIYKYKTIYILHKFVVNTDSITSVRGSREKVMRFILTRGVMLSFAKIQENNNINNKKENSKSMS